ncbi:hypothetical protein SAMN05443287_102357 [Micromonospora phaseoli]|uniref:YCII-related domain-containing protein n=1 Tax=Micromonospora phaseoli TaxID=1144548 RepID=A0A1H6URL2_9ACTN|nr:YciI family protein [Micromonospora phaseoli]PZV99121.1 uncharacterized protein YciI [Micromonospora phaseoli]SEI94868.1 hypothetical protein SAMN05443287_102357 [Micromonospora phaseoli]
MWIVELSLTGTPERLAARGDHRGRLAARHEEGTVRMAGPLADDSGALIIVDLPDRRDVDGFLDADPYFTTEGVTVVQVREWAPFLV